PSNPASPTPTRPPLAIHPSAQISDTTIFQGTHPISIGAHTIIHPRARLYSHEGPILISNNCIISEKTVIGTPGPFPGASRPAPSTTAITTTTSEGTAAAAAAAAAALPIRISSRVTIGPAVSIAPGAHIHSGVVIDALAVINRRVDVGAHARVCAGCEVAAGTGVGEWVVVWGCGGGGGQRRRRRETRGLNKVDGGGEKPGNAPLEARTLEDARLMVLDLEREAVGRLL
ncbi:hypothetical protein BO82DRAFT_244542, partial [Aspergillus uvarum CBS 121591]